MFYLCVSYFFVVCDAPIHIGEVIRMCNWGVLKPAEMLCSWLMDVDSSRQVLSKVLPDRANVRVGNNINSLAIISQRISAKYCNWKAQTVGLFDVMRSIVLALYLRRPSVF